MLGFETGIDRYSNSTASTMSRVTKDRRGGRLREKRGAASTTGKVTKDRGGEGHVRRRKVGSLEIQL
jgi:hypothetical protein